MDTAFSLLSPYFALKEGDHIVLAFPGTAHGPSINVNNIPFYLESVPVKIMKNTVILLKGAMLVSSPPKMHRIPIQDSGVHSCPPHLTMSRKSGC